MPSVILVTCDFGVGHLRQERLADDVLPFTHWLVTGPVPAGRPPEAFFQRRKAVYETEGLFSKPWWFKAQDERRDHPGLMPVWNRLPDVCLAYDRITLWIDPDPNAQLLPALAGVTERRFDLGLHDDPDRHRRFRDSPVSLAALGHRLIAGSDDRSRHNPVHHWWGGTRLTNRMLWRWDAEGRRLQPPSP